MVHTRRASLRRLHAPAPLRLADAIELHDRALAVTGRSPHTRAWYMRCGRAFLSYLDGIGVQRPTVADLRLDTCRAFVIHLRHEPATNGWSHAAWPRSEATIVQYVRYLRSLAHFLVDEEILDADPLRRLKTPRARLPVAIPLTPADIRGLLAATAASDLALRNRALILTLLTTGMRAAELSALRIEKLYLDRGQAVVNGKGNKQRIIVFDDASTVLALTAYLRGRASGPVFVTRDGKPITPGTLRRIVHRLGLAAGVADVHPHRFRHTFALNFLMAHPGALFHLKERLGHTELSMVLRYAKLRTNGEIVGGLTITQAMGLDTSDSAM